MRHVRKELVALDAPSPPARQFALHGCRLVEENHLMREVPLLKRHKRLLLTADAGCERRALQHPLSDVAVGVSQTSEQATHRADVDELARPIIHVIHELIQHHGWVCIDNGLQRLLFSDCEHRASLCIRVPRHDVPGIEEESHPLLDGRRHRSLRVPSSAGRTICRHDRP